MRPLLRSLLAAVFGVTSLAFVSPAALFAQGATGTIEGRVQNRVTGDYLNHARIAVRGTNLIALTDESGTFHLDGVQAGSATLEIFGARMP